MSEFIGLFYAEAFLKAPLGASAARNDVKFINDMQKYSSLQPAVSNACLDSCKRHLWYLTPQLIVFALCDEGLQTGTREQLAKALFDSPKPAAFDSGKPEFPKVKMNKEISIREQLITESSWLLFSILGLDHPEWLQLSVSEWDQNPDYCKLRQFVSNVHVINDIAERGIKLITDFIGHCHDESQRQALLQVVESHREQFPDYSKSTLAKLNC